MFEGGQSLRIVKTIAALCCALVVLLSGLGFIVAWSMDGDPLADVNLLIGYLIVPVFAVAAFIWGSLRTGSERIGQFAAYLSVISMPLLWISLIRL